MADYVYTLYSCDGLRMFHLQKSFTLIEKNAICHIRDGHLLVLTIIELELFLDLRSQKFFHNDRLELVDQEWVVSIVKKGELDIISEKVLSLESPFRDYLANAWMDCELPEIIESDPRNQVKLLTIRWNEDCCYRENYMLEIVLADRKESTCSFLWCPFLSESQRPNMSELADRCMKRPCHVIKPLAASGRERPLSLRTACFEHEYPFSGSVHPKERDTPEELLQLCRNVEDMFSLDRGKGPNMILVNYYLTGHHKISQHADDDKAMGGLRDVYAFVDGFAREMTFRRGYEKAAPIILKVKIPPGFYCMHGRDFQKKYTHEINEIHDKEFSNLCAKLEKHPEFVDFPRKDEHDRVKIPRAEYISNHSEAVERVLKGEQRSISDMWATMERPKKQRKAANQATSWFEEWVQPRISYT